MKTSTLLKKGKELLSPPPGLERQLDCLAFEAAQVYHFLMPLKERADQLRRGLVVVGNKSYGALVVLPIKDMLEKQQITVYDGDVSSRLAGRHGLHTTTGITNLPEEFLKRLLTDQPLVCVVDGTASPHVSNWWLAEVIGMKIPNLKMDVREDIIKYPAATIGYVNLAAVVNETLGLSIASGILSQEHITLLQETQEFQRFVEHLRKSAAPGAASSAYEFAFWNPANLEGVIGLWYFTESFKGKTIPPVNLSTISSPTIIFAASTASKTMLKNARIEPPHHYTPACLDDKYLALNAASEKMLSEKLAFYLSKAQ